MNSVIENVVFLLEIF